MDWIKLGEHCLATQIAITEFEQEQGLKYQPWPPPIMTFAFNQPNIRKFWMHETPSPLDLVFGLDNKIAAIYSGIPLSLEKIGPDFPTDIVVELPAGMAKSLNLCAGLPIEIEYSMETAVRSFKYAKISSIYTLTK